MREALVITNATHKSRLTRKVEEGSTLLVRAARDVVKGDHLDKIVELVKAPEDVDARSRTILAAAALALAQTRARVPVVVVERDDRTVVIRGASAARSSAAKTDFGLGTSGRATPFSRGKFAAASRANASKADESTSLPRRSASTGLLPYATTNEFARFLRSTLNAKI